MAEPRKPEPVEQTLLPGSLSASPSDTEPDHVAPEGTILQVRAPVSGFIPVSPPSEMPSETSEETPEHEGTLKQMWAPVSGFNSAAIGDATQVRPSSRTGVPDRTIGGEVPLPPPPSSAAKGTQIGRFSLKGLHARGGLGEVFTARDVELNREVAVKRIQSRYADDPSSRRRFLTEAEITARLDHPGVVPVFGLVSDGFGRPCYAMRFIRGETLKDEIERYHGINKESASAEPKDEVKGQPRSVAFRHLLQRFIAVCQAIAYAHTRKIIHRDIKPANVMVGAFGETLVVDWGLAKSLEDRPNPELLLKSAANVGNRHDLEATELSDDLTMAGTAVGTPAYMSPEQATGKLELIGPPADVYSLGATLFAILTGKAPFMGNATETLEKVRRGEFPAPRSIIPEVPAPLEAVCLKAMSLRIEDRYATPLDLASDVERWLSDEPVSCYPDPVHARAARWARRHPARVAAGISLLVAGVLAAVVTTVSVAAEQGRTRQALNEAKDERDAKEVEMKRALDAEDVANNRLIALNAEQRATKKEFSRAEEARDEARDRYDAAVKAFNVLVVDIQRQLADRAGTQDLREKLLVKAKEGLLRLIDKSKGKEGIKGGGSENIGTKQKIVADRTIVAAYRQLGDVYRLLGKTHEARIEYQKSVSTVIDLLETAQANKLTDEEWVAREEWGLSEVQLASVQLEAGNTAAARRACETALDQFQQVLKHRPDDRTALENLASAQDQFADVLIERGETAAANKQCIATLEVRRKLADSAKDDLDAQRRKADSLDQYAEILLRSGKSAEAISFAKEALAVRIAVSQKLPKQPDVTRELAGAHLRLGEILFDRDALAPARHEFQEAYNILKDYLGQDTRSAGAKSAQAVSLGWLSAVALRCGDLPTARRQAEESVTLCEELDLADPDSLRTTRDLAVSHERLGDVRLAQGGNSLTAALDSYRESVKQFRKIKDSDPDSALAKLSLAHILERLGEGELTSKDSKTAVKSLTESVELRKDVLAIDAESARAKRELALGLGRLAEAHLADNKYVDARKAIALEIKYLRELMQTDKENINARLDLAQATGKLGDILDEEGKPTLALISVSQSVDQLRELLKADQGNAHILADLATALDRQAAVYAQTGQSVPAKAAAYEALAIRTELAKTQGETKAALREQAIARIRVGDTHLSISEFKRARENYKAARALVVPDPTDALSTATAHLADEKLALLNAVETLKDFPVDGLDKVEKDLRIPALKAAAKSLLNGNQTVTAATLAWQLANTAEAAEDRYRGAQILARCATAENVTASAREGYRDDAVNALKLAVEKGGFRDLERLKGSDWDAFRNFPAFKQVVDSIK